MEAREILAQRAPSLEERINALRDKGVVIGGTTYRYNFAQISAATGVSRSMISMFANGNIRIKPEQQKMLEDWVSDIERQAQEEAIETGAVEETPAPAPQTFKRSIELYQTHEFTEALGLLEWTRDNRKMCVMVGYPGIGKTTVIREFAKRVPDVHVIVCRSTMRMRDLLDSIAESIGVSASGSNDERVRRIQRELAANRDTMLIFDEATASVDSETESQIQSAIESLISGRTTIMIAHRLSTLRKANKIIVLDQGKILEMGTPEELLAAKGKYYKLIQIQTMAEQAEAGRREEGFGD